MNAIPEQTSRSALQRVRAIALWARDTGLGASGFAVVLIVALAGWAASFIGLHTFAMQHMGLTPDQAWLVPLTFDGAPAGLSIVVMRASTYGRGAIVWRVLIVAFTCLSAWINYQHIDDDLGRYVAAFMPPSAVILFEGLMSEARASAKRLNGDRVRPTLHPLRWLFDYSGTLDLYRRHILGLPLPDAIANATKAPQGAATERPAVAPAAAMAAPRVAHTKAPQHAIESAHHGATDDAAKRPESVYQGAPESAMQSAAARHESAIQGATATTAGRPSPATQSATKAPRRAAKGDTRGAARDAIKALYAEHQRRPLESEMVAALKKAKLPHSRQFANARRLEIERAHPELAALGSDNVRPLTGTDN